MLKLVSAVSRAGALALGACAIREASRKPRAVCLTDASGLLAQLSDFIEPIGCNSHADLSARYADRVELTMDLLGQLGDLWEGFDSLNLREQALLILLWQARECGRDARENYRVLRRRLAAHDWFYMSGAAEPDYSRTVDVILSLDLEDYSENQDFRKWLAGLEQKHAYKNTLFLSALEDAKGSGQIRVSEFPWVADGKGRALFTALNSVGRPTYLLGGLGIMAHWHSERHVGRAVRSPQIVSAIEAVVRTLKLKTTEPVGKN